MLAPDTIMRTCLSRAMEQARQSVRGRRDGPTRASHASLRTLQILAVAALTAALALAGVGTYRGPFLKAP